jgi:hypothetical protein
VLLEMSLVDLKRNTLLALAAAPVDLHALAEEMQALHERQRKPQESAGAAVEGLKSGGESDEEAELPCETLFQHLPAEELALQQQQQHKQQHVQKQQLNMGQQEQQAVQGQQQQQGQKHLQQKLHRCKDDVMVGADHVQLVPEAAAQTAPPTNDVNPGAAISEGPPRGPAVVPVAADDDDAQPRELPALLLQRTLQQGTSLAPAWTSLKLQQSGGLAGQQQALKQHASTDIPSRQESVQAFAANNAATATAAGPGQQGAVEAEVTVPDKLTPAAAPEVNAYQPQGEQHKLPTSSIRMRLEQRRRQQQEQQQEQEQEQQHHREQPNAKPPSSLHPRALSLRRQHHQQQGSASTSNGVNQACSSAADRAQDGQAIQHSLPSSDHPLAAAVTNSSQLLVQKIQVHH